MLLVYALMFGTHVLEAACSQLQGQEEPMIRDFFLVGGQYVDSATTAGEHVFQDQVYVEHLRPVGGVSQPYPLVMVHGGSQTATNWLNKPDGGRGWASRFIEQGFELYLVDQPSRGRSTWQPGIGPPLAPPSTVEFTERLFTAPEVFNIWPQASGHTQWNGTGLRGDPVFDQFYAAQVQQTTNQSFQQAVMQTAGADLLDRIGKPVILLGHSQGGQIPIVIADARPDLTAALILIEPSGPPFINSIINTDPARAWGVADIPLVYDPPVIDPSVDLVKQNITAPEPDLFDCIMQADEPAPRKLVNLANKPILLVTSEASFHAPWEYCTVNYLRQAGCVALDWIELGSVGIHGNGHIMFMEKNSDDIQVVLRDWILRL